LRLEPLESPGVKEPPEAPVSVLAPSIELHLSSALPAGWEHDHFFVAPSSLGEDCGLGCFSRVSFHPGSLLGVYKGVRRAILGMVAAEWSYSITVSLDEALDASSMLDFVPCSSDFLSPGSGVSSNPLARANDCAGFPHLATNCRVVPIDDGSLVGFEATRTINPGDELFLSYGTGYWVRHFRLALRSST
jgi:hypothetical protein